MIEEVKNKLATLILDFRPRRKINHKELLEQICQLFEPKPDELVPEGAIPEVQKDKDGNEWLVGYWSSEPNPDEDKCPFERLRTYPGCYEDCPDTDVCPIKSKPKPDEGRLLTDEEILEIVKLGFGSPFDAVAKAQRDLTASIKDARFLALVDCHIAKYVNNKGYGAAYKALSELRQALKKKELK